MSGALIVTAPVYCLTLYDRLALSGARCPALSSSASPTSSVWWLTLDTPAVRTLATSLALGAPHDAAARQAHDEVEAAWAAAGVRV